MTRMNFTRTYENGSVYEAHIHIYISGAVSYSIVTRFSDCFDLDANSVDDAIKAIKRHGFDVSTCTCEVL